MSESTSRVAVVTGVSRPDGVGHAARHDDHQPDGRVLLFTSGQHRGPMADELAYAISKGAVQQMTTSTGRWGQPSDIAGIVSFIASTDSAWITGQTIDAGGGFRS
jgi:3-oxoacyl-[acyl-carrier protein] reductase